MLGKLIKYEWKNTAKVCGSLILFLVIMTAVSCLIFCLPSMSDFLLGDSRSGFTPMLILKIMLLVLYIFAMIGVVYGALIYLGVHFFKSMYSDQGYLTHTLPVNSHQLLISKTLVAGIWYLLITAVMLVSIVALILTIGGKVMSLEGMNIFEELAANWDDIIYAIESVLGAGIVKEALLYLLQIIIGAFCSMMILFGAITIGQLSSKHKVMMSIISYFAITVALQIISSLVMIPITFYTTQQMIQEVNVTMSMTTTPTYTISILINLITAIVLYFLSNYIITRKLNLE